MLYQESKGEHTFSVTHATSTRRIPAGVSPPPALDFFVADAAMRHRVSSAGSKRSGKPLSPARGGAYELDARARRSPNYEQEDRAYGELVLEMRSVTRAHARRIGDQSNIAVHA